MNSDLTRNVLIYNPERITDDLVEVAFNCAKQNNHVCFFSKTPIKNLPRNFTNEFDSLTLIKFVYCDTVHELTNKLLHFTAENQPTLIIVENLNEYFQFNESDCSSDDLIKTHASHIAFIIHLINQIAKKKNMICYSIVSLDSNAYISSQNEGIIQTLLDLYYYEKGRSFCDHHLKVIELMKIFDS